MIFNSYIFCCAFLPITFIGYWLLRKYRTAQNFLLLIASYVFYGWWDVRFLVLIAFTSGCAYVFGLLEIKSKPRSRLSKCRLVVSCIINLGVLGYFKYYNFFVTEAQAMLELLGITAHFTTLQLILPVGISFYTFQALSYTIDVYRHNITPTRDAVAFFAFISFFPQLVAGPIERATNLLPQFLSNRRFSYPIAVDGCRQMLWGFFKKMAVADTCAMYVNETYRFYDQYPASALLAGGILFAFQIYGDFSGYSDIAIGCAKLFGINLTRNFNYPYFSRDIPEFWRRWHTSLTTWFRDYLYIPMGGSRCNLLKKIRNTFVVFLVSGLWHGANWTFVCWGLLHACLFLPYLILGKNRRFINSDVQLNWGMSTIKEFLRIFSTFILVTLGWIVFRSPDIITASRYLKRLFRADIFTIPVHQIGADALPWIVIMLCVEWWQRKKPHGLYFEKCAMDGNRIGHLMRLAIYFLIAVFCIANMKEESAFIYFQF